MAKKTRMGRNLNALLGGATRNRPAEADSGSDSGLEDTPRENSGAKLDSTTSKSAAPVLVEHSTAANRPVADSNSSAPAPKESQSVAPAKLVEKTTTPSQTSVTSDVHANPAVQSPEIKPLADKPAEPSNKTVAVQADSHPTDRLRMLGVDQITRGTYQPRRHFDQELLQELADSITAQGLIQPILVRAYGGKFELIAGERRWRASQLAGITDIPAIVRDMDDQSVAAVSLIENIQRADLNPLEEAQALERLCSEFSMTHQQVAEAVGRSRVAVTNLMRLLELHDDVKASVDRGALDMGHARALLGAPLTDQPGIAKRIVQQGLTVRAVEKLVKDLREGKISSASESVKTDPNIEALGQKLSKLLGSQVNIKHQANGSGKLEISYTSLDELDGILTHIK